MTYPFEPGTKSVVSHRLMNRRYADQARWLAFVLFFALLPNIPFWLASRWLGLLPLGWICIEYTLVGLLALFLPRVVTASLLLLAMTADLISGVSKTYYLSPTDCLQSFASVHELPIHRLVAAAAVGILILALAVSAALFPTSEMRGVFRLRAVFCLAGLFCSALAMDYISVVREVGHFTNPMLSLRPGDTDRFSSADDMWMGRYPALRLTRDQTLFGSRRSLVSSHLSAFAATPSASRATIDLIDEHVGGGPGSSPNAAGPNVVIVLLESWGVDRDRSVRDSLTHAYSDSSLRERYEVSQGTVPFNGPTVSGEARELCNSKIGMQILNISSTDAGACLPARLAAVGYRSIAVHGMDGRMFRRSEWYNSIGFQDIWFRDRFRGFGLPDCAGAFTGTCDASIAQWIGDRLGKREARPDFIYWVTLNSHLPVRVPSSLPEGAACSVSPLLAEQPALCSWYQLVENVHRSIARVAMGPLNRSTIFVVVGDHAPPFANPKLRSQFSGTDVPYVILSPRGQARSGMETAKALGAALNSKPS